MKVTDPPIVVEQIFNNSKEDLWAAITEHRQMIQWFFADIPSFEPRIGFNTQFDVDAGERVFPHIWEIIEVVENEKIVYNWHYGEAWKGRSHVVFEILPNELGNKVKLTNVVVEDFQADIPEFKAESCLGGWNYFIKEQLKNYLENK